MLMLQADQLDALQRLDRERFASGLSVALAELWPLVAGRLGQRFEEFVAAGVAAAQREGLTAPREVAGLVNLWCVWGPAFEAKPGFEWAREILDARDRRADVRLHQLVQRTRDALAKPAASATSPAQLDAALARLPALADSAAARGVFIAPQAGASAVIACDVAFVDIALSDADWRQEYHNTGTEWRRQPAAAVLPALRLEAASAQSQRVATLGPAQHSSPAARLRLRIEALAQCEADRHPALIIDGPQGRLQWRGRDAKAIAQPLLGPQPDLAGTAIAADCEPSKTRISIDNCGVRDYGAPIGPLAIELLVYPAAQHWFECRIGAASPMQLPAKGPTPEPTSVACRLERDGQALDTSRWTSAWQTLQQRITAGMELLLNTWARVAGVENPRLDAQLSALQGVAAMTWGYREDGVETAFVRLEGQIDMLACVADLTLAGEIADGPARARLRMRARGRCDLRTALARQSSALPLDAALAPAIAQWRFPFELDVEPVAGSGPVTLGPATDRPSLTGALLGSAGLRPRGDGGCQWFFSLRCEPGSLATTRFDPLFNGATTSRALLPALVLVDWSSG
jgi:hypothetical protein